MTRAPAWLGIVTLLAILLWTGAVVWWIFR